MLYEVKGDQIMLEEQNENKDEQVITYNNIDYYTEEIQQADTRSDTFYCQEISSDGVVIDENTIYEIDNECLECFQYRH